MKYPKYGDWCKQTIIETIRKQKINDSKNYLEEFVFNPNSDLYSTGVYDYEIFDILWSINSDDLMGKSLFLAVQHAFDEEYFQKAQRINLQMSMKSIRHDGGDSAKLLFETFNDITIDELKIVVMYAFDYGKEEVEEPKIPYVKITTGNIATVIKSGLTELKSVHIDYLNPDAERKNISTDQFIDYLMHLNQSGIFADTVNWRYTDLFDSGKYLLECDINHNNGCELNACIAVKNKEDKEKVVEMLGKMEG